MFTESILTGIIANALTHTFTESNIHINRNNISSLESLDKLISKGITKEVKKLYLNNEIDQKIVSFLTSAEVHNIVKKVFSFDFYNNYEDKPKPEDVIRAEERTNRQFGNNKIIIDKHKLFRKENVATVPNSIADEFYALAEFCIGDAIHKVDIRNLFNCIIKICTDALNTAIDKGYLFASHATENVRQRMVLGKLDNIERSISFYKEKDKCIIKDFDVFISAYYKLIRQRYNSIEPASFDEAKRLAIKDIYVLPIFNYKRPTSDDYNKYRFDHFLRSMNRRVVLGDPGCGKTTLSRVVTFTQCSPQASGNTGSPLLIPFLIVIRKFGADYKTDKKSILEYIVENINSSMQLNVYPDLIEYLFLTGRALIIFDGLDELLDIELRRDVREAIESFCVRYTEAKILVTSRKVGYEQTPLSTEYFDEYSLCPFNEAQVSSYITKWFSIESNYNSEDAQLLIESLVSETKGIPDLLENPLMLSLVCSLYKGINYIPRNKSDVYEKCAEMLYERWDPGRGIHYKINYEAHFRKIIGEVALWIFSEPTMKGEVSKNKLYRRIVDYLLEMCTDSREEAEYGAKQYVDFFTGRAWVFTDIGVTSDFSDDVYAFAHRTFLEYFAAKRTTELKHTTSDLLELILPKIIHEEWDVFSQLVLNINDRNNADSTNEIYNNIITELHQFNEIEKWNALSFLIRCMLFLTPKPEIRKSVINNFFLIYLDQSKITNDLRVNGDVLINNLLSVVPEYKRMTFSIIIECIEQALSDGDTHSKLLASETYFKFISPEITIDSAIGRQCAAQILGLDKTSLNRDDLLNLISDFHPEYNNGNDDFDIYSTTYEYQDIDGIYY
ncbi:MAG: NACHT domain-containing protein [Gammaproteobacteria bacterium]|nr:NACHT domain-containing protein [Gammaproteobacteria bacterium]